MKKSQISWYSPFKQAYLLGRKLVEPAGWAEDPAPWIEEVPCREETSRGEGEQGVTTRQEEGLPGSLTGSLVVGQQVRNICIIMSRGQHYAIYRFLSICINSDFKFTALCTILRHCVQSYCTVSNLTTLGPWRGGGGWALKPLMFWTPEPDWLAYLGPMYIKIPMDVLFIRPCT